MRCARLQAHHPADVLAPFSRSIDRHEISIDRRFGADEAVDLVVNRGLTAPSSHRVLWIAAKRGCRAPTVRNPGRCASQSPPRRSVRFLGARVGMASALASVTGARCARRVAGGRQLRDGSEIAVERHNSHLRGQEDPQQGPYDGLLRTGSAQYPHSVTCRPVVCTERGGHE